LKQLAVAEDAGITVAHLSKNETGKVNPTWGNVAVVGVTVAEIAERASSTIDVAEKAPLFLGFEVPSA
jgi:predicted transcriptional regulator